MFDLALTEKGDLMFQRNTQRTDPLRISFTVSNANTFKIKFQVEDCNAISHDGSGLKIQFDIEQGRYINKALILEDYDAKIQAIKIRLQSTIGDIAGHTDIGSRLETVKHLCLTDSKVQTKAISLVKTAISDIITDPTVIVKPTISTDSSGGYVQKLVIYIYDDDILIYKYDVGV